MNEQNTDGAQELGAVARLVREVDQLRAALEETQSTLKQVTDQRDAAKRAVTWWLSRYLNVQSERDRATRRCRELEEICMQQQGQLHRAFERLGESKQALSRAERLAAMVTPSETRRVMRVQAVTVGAAQ